MTAADGEHHETLHGRSSVGRAEEGLHLLVLRVAIRAYEGWGTVEVPPHGLKDAAKRLAGRLAAGKAGGERLTYLTGPGDDGETRRQRAPRGGVAGDRQRWLRGARNTWQRIDRPRCRGNRAGYGDRWRRG